MELLEMLPAVNRVPRELYPYILAHAYTLPLIKNCVLRYHRYVKDKASFFLWQNVGVGLMTIAPAVTFSLKKKADAGQLGDPVSQILNVGVLAAALGHLSVLLPMLQAGQGGPLLPWLGAAWATAGLAGGWGLFARQVKK
jgi:hypothetical protein